MKKKNNEISHAFVKKKKKKCVSAVYYTVKQLMALAFDLLSIKPVVPNFWFILSYTQLLLVYNYAIKPNEQGQTALRSIMYFVGFFLYDTTFVSVMCC